MKAVAAASMTVATILATLLCFGQEKRKSGKTGDVVVVESEAHRSDGRVSLEGRVKNVSAKALNGLVLLIDFIGTDGQVVSTKRSPVDEDVLEPESEASFRFETSDPVRAVEFRIQAEEGNGRELRVAPSASKPIE